MLCDNVYPVTRRYPTNLSILDLNVFIWIKKKTEYTDMTSHNVTENRFYIFLFLYSILPNHSGIKYMIPVVPDIFISATTTEVITTCSEA